jgi:hypothetical protein
LRPSRPAFDGTAGAGRGGEREFPSGALWPSPTGRHRQAGFCARSGPSTAGAQRVDGALETLAQVTRPGCRYFLAWPFGFALNAGPLPEWRPGQDEGKAERASAELRAGRAGMAGFTRRVSTGTALNFPVFGHPAIVLAPIYASLPSLGPSSIPSLPDGVMFGRAWIDRPVDTQDLHSLLPRPPQRGMEARPCSSQ